jgi:hypothetical protein
MEGIMLVLLCRERERERERERDVWCLFLSVISSSFCCIIWMAERENEWVLADIYLGVMTMEVSGERAGNMDSGSVFFPWIIIVGLHDLVYFLFEQLVEWPWRRQRKRWWCALGFQRRGREIFISPPYPGRDRTLCWWMMMMGTVVN